MEITEVRVTLRNERKLKAFASITLDRCFVIRGLKVISGSQGYFVSMPCRKRRDGSFQDLAHPINNEMRKVIEDTVLDAFELELNSHRASRKPIPGSQMNDPVDAEVEADEAIEVESAENVVTSRDHS